MALDTREKDVFLLAWKSLISTSFPLFPQKSERKKCPTEKESRVKYAVQPRFGGDMVTKSGPYCLSLFRGCKNGEGNFLDSVDVRSSVREQGRYLRYIWWWGGKVKGIKMVVGGFRPGRENLMGFETMNDEIRSYMKRFLRLKYSMIKCGSTNILQCH